MILSQECCHVERGRARPSGITGMDHQNSYLNQKHLSAAVTARSCLMVLEISWSHSSDPGPGALWRSKHPI